MRTNFTYFLLTILMAIFLSPAFGIHLHHDTDEFGNHSVIHSYFFENHDSAHPPTDTPPETLPEHLTTSGMAEDMGGWDTGLNFLEGINLKLILFFLIGIFYFTRNSLHRINFSIFAIPPTIKNQSLYFSTQKIHLFPNFHSLIRFTFHQLHLPPPYNCN